MTDLLVHIEQAAAIVLLLGIAVVVALFSLWAAGTLAVFVLLAAWGYCIRRLFTKFRLVSWLLLALLVASFWPFIAYENIRRWWRGLRK